MVTDSAKPFFTIANSITDAQIKVQGSGVTACFTADHVVDRNGNVFPINCYWGCNRNNYILPRRQ